MHLRLMAGFLLRLPSLLARRLAAGRRSEAVPAGNPHRCNNFCCGGNSGARAGCPVFQIRSDDVFEIHAVAALVVAGTLGWQAVSAQSAEPVTREQRKAETAAANKSGQLTPAGKRRAAIEVDQHQVDQVPCPAQAGDRGGEQGGPADAGRTGRCAAGEVDQHRLDRIA
jgi:hypothetical protein